MVAEMGWKGVRSGQIFKRRNLMGVRTACVRDEGESRGESRSQPGYAGDADARRHRGELGWGSRWARCCVFWGASQIRLASGTPWERCQGRDTDFRDAHRGGVGAWNPVQCMELVCVSAGRCSHGTVTRVPCPVCPGLHPGAQDKEQVDNAKREHLVPVTRTRQRW